MKLMKLQHSPHGVPALVCALKFADYSECAGSESVLCRFMEMRDLLVALEMHNFKRT